MKKLKLLIFCIIIEVMLIACISLANLNPVPILYFLFYYLMYGLLFSFIVPLYLLYREKGTFSSVGIKKPGVRQLAVLIIFDAFSIGGQLIPLITAGEPIRWHLLPMGIFPLIMTTFFEEFLLRGFVQSRIEQECGWFPSIFVSGLMFSLYHLGYPGFRTLEDLLLLLAVGLGFAAAYKISDNSLFVSYFVNLPNAFVTYMLKYEQFPAMNLSSSAASVITLAIIAFIFFKTGRHIFATL